MRAPFTKFILTQAKREDGEELRMLRELHELYEPCLFEVLIGRQRFGDSGIAHHQEARAIDKAPSFIGSFPVELPSARVKILPNPDYFTDAALPAASFQLYRQGTSVWSGQGVCDFHQDQGSRDQEDVAVD